jgi:hypothetical protein
MDSRTARHRANQALVELHGRRNGIKRLGTPHVVELERIYYLPL